MRFLSALTGHRRAFSTRLYDNRQRADANGSQKKVSDLHFMMGCWDRQTLSERKISPAVDGTKTPW